MFKFVIGLALLIWNSTIVYRDVKHDKIGRMTLLNAFASGAIFVSILNQLF
jgi:hypothetical protein